jgi:Fic family protein
MKEPKIEFGQPILQLIAEIDHFKGQWSELTTLSPDRLQALKRVATIESVGSSTRIEGASLSDPQVETLLSGLQTLSFKTRDQQEVAGYAEAMDLVFQSYADLRITENHIRQLHQTLLRHSDKDVRHRGEYKKFTNHVVARDTNGQQIGVVFKTTTPFDTPREMESLVHWINKATDENALHPLLAIGAFIVKFLAIHPFQDGNGRVSRILTTLMLLRAGYVYVPYASLERVIENNKDLYYKALRRTQTTLAKDKVDWEPWIGFFLRCLKTQKDVLAAKIIELKAQTGPISGDVALPEIAAQVLSLLHAHPRLTATRFAELTGGNPNTLKVRLRELVSSGRIRRHGKGRATWYTLP